MSPWLLYPLAAIGALCVLAFAAVVVVFVVVGAVDRQMDVSSGGRSQ